MKHTEFGRSVRVGDQIRRELAVLVSRELADPRVGEVTVSGVDVSADLRHARVLVTPGRGTDGDASAAALNHAAGFLRSKLARRIRLRRLPSLLFEHDRTLERALRIEALIHGTPAASDPAGRESC